MIGIIVGIMWNGQAGDKQKNIFPVQGAIFICCVNATMDTIFQTALVMPNLRPLVRREYHNGYWRLWSFYLASVITHAALQCFNIILLGIPVSRSRADAETEARALRLTAFFRSFAL